MASPLRRVSDLVAALKAVVHSDERKARELIPQIKLALTELPSQAPGTTVAATAAEADAARDFYETAIAFAVRTRDFKAFERNVAQLRPYFALGSASTAATDSRRHVEGLFLMHLLAEGRLDAFHMAVEALDAADATAAYIAFPLTLERNLMEGAYNQIIRASHTPPSELYAPFMTRLVETARTDIADCMAAAYPSITLEGARTLMMLDTTAQVVAFAAKHKPEWSLEGDRILFSRPHKARAEIDAHELIASTAGYATEMERIV